MSMEQLSIQDGNDDELPPQMFTTAAQLLELTDSEDFKGNPPTDAEKLVVVLRDGRKILGPLRSWDQFGNLVLTEAVERVFVRNVYADIPRGVFLVRGENLVMLGEIDLDRDDYIPPGFRQVSESEIFLLQRDEQRRQKSIEASQAKRLMDIGFEVEHAGEIFL